MAGADILLAVTGHRVMVTGHRQGFDTTVVRPVLRHILERLILRKTEGLTAISGMALGVDIEFAEVALELGIPLIAAVPFEGQHLRWPSRAQNRYAKVLLRAACIISVWREPGYDHSKTVPDMLLTRNDWMLDHSNTTIAVWSGIQKGGTAHAVRGTALRGRKVLWVHSTTGALQTYAPPPSLRKEAKTSSFAVPFFLDPLE